MDAASGLEADRALLLDAVREAGALALTHFHGAPKSWDKGGGHPVTEADMAVDLLLRERLTAARPDYGWLSEESADDKRRLQCRRAWICDPIDGTRAFMKHVPEFTICVALVEDGRPLLGAVFNPAKEEFFEAVANGGARLNGEDIRPSGLRDVGAAHFLTAKKNMSHFDWPKPAEEMLCTWMNSIAYRMALVACGRYDAVISMTGKHDWDIAAAELILAEAGACCSGVDYRGFVYNQAHPRHANMVASAPGLHDEILAVLTRG